MQSPIPINPFTITYVVLVLIAIVDIWLSRLSSAAKLIWTVNVIFLVVVAPVSWAITRHTAYRELEEIPEVLAA